MSDKTVGDPILRYAKVNSLMLKTYSEKCTDFKYNSMIKDLQNVTWSSSAGEGGKYWGGKEIQHSYEKKVTNT